MPLKCSLLHTSSVCLAKAPTGSRPSVDAKSKPRQFSVHAAHSIAFAGTTSPQTLRPTRRTEFAGLTRLAAVIVHVALAALSSCHAGARPTVDAANAEVGDVAGPGPGLTDSYSVRDLGPGRCLAISADGIILGLESATDIPGEPGTALPATTTPFVLTPDGAGGYARKRLGKRAEADSYSVLTQIRGQLLSGFSQGPAHTEAVLYNLTTSSWTTLGGLHPDDLSEAVGVTSDGWVAGYDRTFPEQDVPFNRAILYAPDGTISDLGPAVARATGGQRSVALAISEAGLLVHRSRNAVKHSAV